MAANEKMIEIEGLTKDFDSFRAVDNVTFDLEKGEVLGFLGPNGAGKSTTMKMVAGYLPISSGTASVCGSDVAKFPLEAKSKIGYLPEGAPLYSDMTTMGFLKFISEVRGFSGAEKEVAVNLAIKKLQLESVMNQPIETLSKGFKRRVGFAQAILHDPDILILDEPTDGLDPNQKYQVRELIKEMARDKAIIISTHILEEVEAVCSRAVIIAAGRVVFDDTPEKLKAKSTNGSLDQVFRELTHH
jgi:ABC-2 type transport system ATP-binding protein